MKPIKLPVLLIVLSICILFSQQVKAADPYVYTYSSIDYDGQTNTVNAYAYSDPDYQTGAYYFRNNVTIKILDENNVQMATQTQEVVNGSVDLHLEVSGNGSQEYTLKSGHWMLAYYYVNNYYQDGYYVNGYLDNYNYLHFAGQVQDGYNYFYYLGEYRSRAVSSNFIFFGQLSSQVVKLILLNSGTIIPAPENEDYNAEVATSGTNLLGPLPMGQGRTEFPGAAYTSPIMVYGTIKPATAYSLNYQWIRYLSRRSWYIRFNDAGDNDPSNDFWFVTQRTSRGVPVRADDTGSSDFNDPTPSINAGRVYIYDNSALLPGNDAADHVGDFIHEEKRFLYVLQRQDRGSWVNLSSAWVGQIITVRRSAVTGSVAADWQGIENSNASQYLDATISEAEVRAIVGGTTPIMIDSGANN